MKGRDLLSITDLSPDELEYLINLALSMKRDGPCQALADLLTVREKKGHLDGVRIAFIGDGNNVSASLALAAARCGAQFVIAAPPGYELTEQVVADARQWARKTGGSIETVVAPE